MINIEVNTVPTRRGFKLQQRLSNPASITRPHPKSQRERPNSNNVGESFLPERRTIGLREFNMMRLGYVGDDGRGVDIRKPVVDIPVKESEFAPSERARNEKKKKRQLTC